MDERQAIPAANDTDFHASRYRTVPTLASVTPIANYPTKLRILKTSCSKLVGAHSMQASTSRT
jgi:hypothetical protein